MITPKFCDVKKYILTSGRKPDSYQFRYCPGGQLEPGVEDTVIYP